MSSEATNVCISLKLHSIIKETNLIVVRLNLLPVFLVIIASSIINISFAPIGAIPLYHIFPLYSIDGMYKIRYPHLSKLLMAIGGIFYVFCVNNRKNVL